MIGQTTSEHASWKTRNFSGWHVFSDGNTAEVMKRNVSVLPGSPTEEPPEKRPKDRSWCEMWGLKG